MIVHAAPVYVTAEAYSTDGQVVSLPHNSGIYGVRTPDGYAPQLTVFVAGYEVADGLDADAPTRLYRLWARRCGDTVPRIPGGTDWEGLVTLKKEPTVMHLRRWHA